VNDEERLEALEKVLSALDERDETIIVEGQRDEAALRVLGVGAPVVQVQTARGVTRLAERLARAGIRRVVVLVDWDRTGGRVARLLADALPANGIAADLACRREVARLAKKGTRAVEELPAFMAALEATRRPRHG